MLSKDGSKSSPIVSHVLAIHQGAVPPTNDHVTLEPGRILKPSTQGFVKLYQVHRVVKAVLHQLYLVLIQLGKVLAPRHLVWIVDEGALVFLLFFVVTVAGNLGAFKAREQVVSHGLAVRVELRNHGQHGIVPVVVGRIQTKGTPYTAFSAFYVMSNEQVGLMAYDVLLCIVHGVAPVHGLCAVFINESDTHRNETVLTVKGVFGVNCNLH